MGGKLLMRFVCTSGATKLPTNSNIWGFSGLMSLASYKGPVATTWGPMGARVRALSPNDHPNPSQGRQRGKLEEFKMLRNLQMTLNNLNNSNFGAFGGPMVLATWA